MLRRAVDHAAPATAAARHRSGGGPLPLPLPLPRRLLALLCRRRRRRRRRRCSTARRAGSLPVLWPHLHHVGAAQKQLASALRVRISIGLLRLASTSSCQGGAGNAASHAHALILQTLPLLLPRYTVTRATVAQPRPCRSGVERIARRCRELCHVLVAGGHQPQRGARQRSPGRHRRATAAAAPRAAPQSRHSRRRAVHRHNSIGHSPRAHRPLPLPIALADVRRGHRQQHRARQPPHAADRALERAARSLPTSAPLQRRSLAALHGAPTAPPPAAAAAAAAAAGTRAGRGQRRTCPGFLRRRRRRRQLQQ